MIGVYWQNGMGKTINVPQLTKTTQIKITGMVLSSPHAPLVCGLSTSSQLVRVSGHLFVESACLDCQRRVCLHSRPVHLKNGKTMNTQSQDQTGRTSPEEQKRGDDCNGGGGDMMMVAMRDNDGGDAVGDGDDDDDGGHFVGLVMMPNVTQAAGYSRVLGMPKRQGAAPCRFFGALSFSESPMVSSGLYQAYFEPPSWIYVTDFGMRVRLR